MGFKLRPCTDCYMAYTSDEDAKEHERKTGHIVERERKVHPMTEEEVDDALKKINKED